MLVSSKKMLWNAWKNGYAVGAFNTSNLEITQAIIDAAAEMNAPVIVQTSPSAIEYAGLQNMVAMVRSLASQVKIPVALHLDHGLDVELAERCIKAGYTSVMLDASSKPFEENSGMVRKVVSMARWHGIQVEAEIGRLQGIEDQVKVDAKEALYTTSVDAVTFARASKCDSLAVAIGTSHGAFKYVGKSSIRLDILKEINDACKIPLVLHGASGVPQDIVKMANKYGAKIKGAKGVDEELIKAAVKLGISKVNEDTDLRLAFTAAVRKQLAAKPNDFNPREIMMPARDLIKHMVMDRIKVYGSEGKA